jgi:hypothetical protein
VEYMATASAGGELGRSAEVAEVVYEASRVADAARLGGRVGFGDGRRIRRRGGMMHMPGQKWEI